MERFAENELEKRVDEVLYYKWDPIEINHEPYARAEYRSYVTRILSHLENNKSANEISNHLCNIESMSMGMTPNKSKALEIANILITHKEAIDKGCA